MTPTTYCVIHCRVSTGKQAREGESLELQARICREIAERNGWTLAHEPWLEAHTGSASSRPAFDDVLAFLDRNPNQVRYYLFRSIDRFTRGGVDLYNPMKRALMQRGAELIDSMGVIQPTKNTLAHLGFEYAWSEDDPSEITQLVMATTAKTEKTTILTRLIGAEISLAQQGYRVRKAADGYQNKRVYVDGKRRYIQEVDPVRAKFYIAMFELRASGSLSDREIVDRINAMGFRRRLFERWNADKTEAIGHGGGGPLTVARFQEIVRNPIYCGVVYEKWTHWKPVRAPYDGLVSIETYNAANRGKRYIHERAGTLELIHDYRSDRETRVLSRTNPEFPFKNVIMCPLCEKPFRGSATRGKSGKAFPAYHCDRAHKRVGVKKATFETIVRTYIEGLRFDEIARPTVVKAACDAFASRQTERGATRKEIERATADLETQKAEIVKAFMGATSATMRSALEAKIEHLETEISRSKSNDAMADISQADFDAYLAEAQKILEHPHTLLENPANMREQRSDYALVFNPLPTIAELRVGTPKMTSIFKLCDDVSRAKYGLAGQLGFSWNQLESEIQRWKLRRQELSSVKKARPLSASFIPPDRAKDHNPGGDSGAEPRKAI